jgi:hypothetical protein
MLTGCSSPVWSDSTPALMLSQLSASQTTGGPPVGVASVGAIASEWYYELPGNTQQTVYYNATGGGAPDDGNGFIISNSRMKIEGIKR